MAKNKIDKQRNYKAEVNKILQGNGKKALTKCIDKAGDRLKPHFESVRASQQLSSADYAVKINTID